MRHLASSTGGILRNRPGYTLIELLVVIAIIAVLAGLSVSGSMMVITSQRERNTKTTIRSLDGERKKQIKALIHQAQGENMDLVAGGTAMATIRAMAGNDEKRVRVLYVKFRLKQEFPTSYAEALNPAPLLAKRNYMVYLNQHGITSGSTPPAAHESSACLYMAFTEARGGDKINLEQLGSSVQDFPAPTKPIKGFADGWGNPLAFYRWPTGDAALDALAPNTNSLARDPEDPQGLLRNPAWYATAGRASFETSGHLVSRSGGAYAYYLIPVIASAGRDGRLGLQNDGTLTVSNPTDARDNIYSYQLERE